MRNLNEFDRDLLSAYLDDALDGSERLRAEELLATNPGASRYVNQLRSTSQCLKSVPSSTLRSSLAARVLEQARAQALADGLPSDHHVLRGFTQPEQARDPLAATEGTAASDSFLSASVDRATSAARLASSQSPALSGPTTGGLPGDAASHSDEQTIPSSEDRWSTRGGWLPRSNRILWSALAVAAAVIVTVAILPPTSVDPPVDLVAELVPPELPVEDQAVGSEHESSPFDSVASSDRGAGAASDRVFPSGGPIDAGQPLGASDGVAHVMQGSGAGDSLKEDLTPELPAFDFLMIIDSVVASKAWESGRFERLLEELEIPIASPIIADEALFQALEETRVVVGDPANDAGAAQPRAALVFLRADGATLDRLHQAMHADSMNFLQVVTDISIDQQSAALHQLLRGQASAQSLAGPSARVLSSSTGVAGVGSGGEVVPDFVPAARTKMVSSERSPALSVPAVPGFNLGGESPMSEVLVILREPSAE